MLFISATDAHFLWNVLSGSNKHLHISQELFSELLNNI